MGKTTWGKARRELGNGLMRVLAVGDEEVAQ